MARTYGQWATDAFAAGLFVVLLSGVLNTDRPTVIWSHPGQNNAIESKRLDPSFAWEVEDADDPKKEVLHIRYVDGRRYGFRVASITSYQFFPASAAKMLGYSSPALKIQVGASSLRLDITNEEATELMRLFAETRPGEAGSNIKSSAK